MRTRPFAHAALALATAFLGAGCSRPEPGPESLLLVTVDTLRADHVGINGGPVPTPQLDALARRGVALTQAYTPTPTTAPAHASLFTGLHPWRHGVLNNAVPLHPEMPTLAERLHDAGFITGAFVASYILHERFGFGRGFDSYALVADQGGLWRGRARAAFYGRGEQVAAEADAWIADRAPGERFFLWVHLFDPHAPYDPPERFAVADDQPVDLHHKQIPPGLDGRADLVEAIHDYRGEVKRVDAQIGKLVAALDAAGLSDSTAIVVTADHGEGLGDHHLLGHGKYLFEELVRVPWIVAGPGIPARGPVEGLAQLEDLFPTVLGLLGVAPPDDLDGVDLGPWLRGEVPESPRTAVVGRRKVYPGEPTLLYLHSGDRKWIGALDGAGRLFSLTRDPDEAHGRYAPAPELLSSALVNPAPVAARDLDAESRRALEALGYLEPRRAAP
ncbi:MAG TPA: sulfatase [Myxococcota bacterium]|nr:sulfatase [Myxococcota bacterium]